MVWKKIKDFWLPRRDFLKSATTAAAVAMWQGESVFSDRPVQGAEDSRGTNGAVPAPLSRPSAQEMPEMKNMIGPYGTWAADIVGDEPARLSFRRSEFRELEDWRRLARQRVLDRLLQPDVPPIRDVQVDQRLDHDGLIVEKLSWQLHYGPRTQALFLRPAHASGALPGVLALHDHGGNKYFGLEKITQTARESHPAMRHHQEEYYGGRAWANALRSEAMPSLSTMRSLLEVDVSPWKASAKPPIAVFPWFKEIRRPTSMPITSSPASMNT